MLLVETKTQVLFLYNSVDKENISFVFEVPNLPTPPPPLFPSYPDNIFTSEKPCRVLPHLQSSSLPWKRQCVVVTEMERPLTSGALVLLFRPKPQSGLLPPLLRGAPASCVTHCKKKKTESLKKSQNVRQEDEKKERDSKGDTDRTDGQKQTNKDFK